MNSQDTLKKTSDFLSHSATLKVLGIGLLLLVLLIPTSMVSSVMQERASRRNTVVEEIFQKWGNSQTLTGPYFTIPYKEFYKDNNKDLKFMVRHLNIMPENLKIRAQAQTEIRYRGIYEAVLYTANIQVNGNFKFPSLAQTNIDPENVMWEKAVFSIGISDLRGIRDAVNVSFNDQSYPVNPGLITDDICSSGIHCYVPLAPERNQPNAFSFQLHLNGSDEIRFIPLGETTLAHLESGWPSPSFSGAFLPTTRNVSGKGFSADWKILHLNRNFPQFWEGNLYKVGEAGFGTKLLILADIYQKSERLAKYAVMFIVFTFSAFFFSEIISRKKVHPIQYLLIGLAVLLFYLLILALSEHISFGLAYLLSASAITLAITGYSWGILKNKIFSLTVLGILTILYAYLYMVLQLEDYALLMGSIGLFVVLASVMYITRKIDWYALEKDKT